MRLSPTISPAFAVSVGSPASMALDQRVDLARQL